MRKAKKQELKSLKKLEKKKAEAEKFELKYKKIKFFGKKIFENMFLEKKKVIKHLESIEKELNSVNEEE